MPCISCNSSKQSLFPAEVNIHFPGFKNLTKPTVLVSACLVICFDCGFTQFTLSDDQVERLRGKEVKAAGAA